MSTVVLTIDGVAKEPDKRTLRITNIARQRGSLRAVITSEDGSYIPERGKAVVCTEDAAAIFGGIIRNTTHRGVANKTTEAIATEIECDDFTVLPTRRVATITLPAGTVKSQVETLRSAYLSIYSVTLHGSQVDGPNVPELVLVNRYVSEAFLDICKAASSVTDTEWVFTISPTKVLRFEEVDNRPAPFDIDTSTDNPRVDFEDIPVEKSGDRYANRIIELAGGDQPRHINQHISEGSQEDALNDTLDQEVGKHYADDAVTLGEYRCWSLATLVVSLKWSTDGRGCLKTVNDPNVNGAGGFPQALTPFADGTVFEANRRWYLERTYDIPAEEPDLFLPLNEASGDALDAGAGGNNGTVQGTPTRGRLGITCDGTNDRIDLTGQTNFGATWAFECDFTPDATQADTRGLLFGEQASGDGVVWNKTSGKVEVRDGGVTIAESSALVSGTNYKLFVSCDAGAVTIYINGLEDGTGTGFNVAADPDGIGGDSANAFSFKGTIRNVAYYPAEKFSADGVTQHYARVIDRLMQAASETPITSGGYVAIAYVGFYPIRVVANDETAQGANQENLVEATDEAPWILTRDAAEARAQSVLAERLNTSGSLRYLTDQTALEPGQKQHITAAERQIDDDFILQQVEIADLGGNFLARTVTAAAGGRLPASAREQRQQAAGPSANPSAGVVTTAPSAPNLPLTAVGSVQGKTLTSDQTYTNNTTPTDIADLSFAMGANETWIVWVMLFYSAGTAGDLNLAWNLPAGATAFHGAIRAEQNTSNAGATSMSVTAGGSGGRNFGGVGAGTQMAGLWMVTMTSGVAGGTAILQGYQNVSSGTASVVYAKSSLLAVKAA